MVEKPLIGFANPESERYFGVTLEELNGNFIYVKEGLFALEAKMDKQFFDLREEMNCRFDILTVRVELLEKKIGQIEKRVTQIEARLIQIEVHIGSMQKELREIRKELKSKIDNKRYLALEHRVTEIEKIVG